MDAAHSASNYIRRGYQGLPYLAEFRSWPCSRLRQGRLLKSGNYRVANQSIAGENNQCPNHWEDPDTASDKVCPDNHSDLAVRRPVGLAPKLSMLKRTGVHCSSMRRTLWKRRFIAKKWFPDFSPRTPRSWSARSAMVAWNCRAIQSGVSPAGGRFPAIMEFRSCSGGTIGRPTRLT